mgnify:CR=1 FL=1
MRKDLKRVNGAVIITDPSLRNKILSRKEKEKRLDTMEDKLNKIETLLTRLLEKNG